MRNISRVAALLAVSVLATGCGDSGAGVRTSQVALEEAEARVFPAPPSLELPKAGTFRLRWVAEESDASACAVPGIYMGAGDLPQIAVIQIDYVGPKRWIEFIVENTVDGSEPSEPTETTIHREGFGAASLVVEGNHAFYNRSGKPLSSKRQGFLLRGYSLSECGDRNGLLWLASFDAEEQAHYRASQAEFYASAFDLDHSNGGTSFGHGELRYSNPFGLPGPFVGPEAPLDDDESPTLLKWTRGDATTRLKIRFTDEE